MLHDSGLFQTPPKLISWQEMGLFILQCAAGAATLGCLVGLFVSQAVKV